jgi:hypothetical protein
MPFLSPSHFSFSSPHLEWPKGYICFGGRLNLTVTHSLCDSQTFTQTQPSWAVPTYISGLLSCLPPTPLPSFTWCGLPGAEKGGRGGKWPGSGRASIGDIELGKVVRAPALGEDQGFWLNHVESEEPVG